MPLRCLHWQTQHEIWWYQFCGALTMFSTTIYHKLFSTAMIYYLLLALTILDCPTFAWWWYRNHIGWVCLEEWVYDVFRGGQRKRLFQGEWKMLGTSASGVAASNVCFLGCSCSRHRTWPKLCANRWYQWWWGWRVRVPWDMDHCCVPGCIQVQVNRERFYQRVCFASAGCNMSPIMVFVNRKTHL